VADAAEQDPLRKRAVGNADRLLAWQFNWRGENFHRRRLPAAHSRRADRVHQGRQRGLQEVHRGPERNGGAQLLRDHEKSRVAGFPNALPGKPMVKQTYKIEDSVERSG
jgi:hypothetical protein